MAKYIIQGETLKAIADEVRDLTDITDEINPNEMIANMEQVNADVAAQMEIIEQIRTALDGKAGSNAAEIGVIIDNSGVLDSTEGTVEEKVEQLVEKAEWEKVWYEMSGYFTNNFPSFAKTTYETLPRMNLSNVTTLIYKFSAMPNLKRIEHYMNTDNCTDFSSCFQGDGQLEYVKGLNISKGTSFGWFFANCSSLKIIENPLDFSSAISSSLNPFGGCNALEEIRLVPETINCSIYIQSPVLSAESIQSIFDGLATVETAQTLTLNANLKILQSQVDSANAKGWTIAGGTVVSEEEYYG